MQSEYLVASDDGDYVNMVCRTWIDLSREHVLAQDEDPTWQTDFSQIRSKERNDIVPLLPISDDLADQLLLPLQAQCASQSIDIWMYTICIDWFVRQEIISNNPKNPRKPESFSLGNSAKLSETQIGELMQSLEDGNQKLEEIKTKIEKE